MSFFCFLGYWGSCSGACACSLFSVVLCTRIGVLVPGFTVFLVDYSLDYVLYSVHCLIDFALCEFVHCYRHSLFILLCLKHVSTFSVAGSCIAVYLFRCSYGVGLVLGFGLVALECE